jgi:hypothetical protein
MVKLLTSQEVSMKRVHVLAAAGLAALVLAPAAGAAGEPAAFATATRGSLNVVSEVIVVPRAVLLFGGWFNEAVPCNQFRRLVVVGRLEYRARGGGFRIIRREKTAVRMNCAEGGPNLGFTIKAAPNELSCPDGTWQPGRYSFLTRTTHLASGMRSIASLDWEVTGTC